MIYGENLCLPTDPVVDIRAELNHSGMLRPLKDAISKMRPTPSSRHVTLEFSTPRGLEPYDQVLIRVDTLWKPLQPPYEGSFKVPEGGKHSFKLDVQGRTKWVSLSRIKAFDELAAASKKPLGSVRSVSVTPIGGITRTISFAKPARVQLGAE